MTDKEKLEKVRAEIERRVKCHAESSDPLASAYVSEDNAILSYIDSMQEEPVSEDLEQAVNAYIGYAPEVDESSSTYGKRQAFKAGANWKEQMMKEAVKVKISNASIVSLPVNCNLKVGDKVLIIKETDADKSQFEREMWDKCNSYIQDLME